MTTATRTLLAEVLDAHGGLDTWRKFTTVTASVVSGGFLWSMKGIDIDDAPRALASTFRRQWTRIAPFGNANWHMTYEPNHVVIESGAGEVIAEQHNPRETFAGHTWETPWTPAQLGYFQGYAMWTYYNLPFVIGEPGFEVAEIPSLTQDGQSLTGLCVSFPREAHTHCAEQSLYFDDRGLLRRHDYEVDVAGKRRAAHLVGEYVDVQGLRLPTRRRVFLCNADGTLQLDRAVVTIDLSDFRLS